MTVDQMPERTRAEAILGGRFEHELNQEQCLEQDPYNTRILTRARQGPGPGGKAGALEQDLEHKLDQQLHKVLYPRHRTTPNTRKLLIHPKLGLFSTAC